MSQCECTACGEKFKSPAGFDKHRIGGWGDAIYKANKSHDIIGYTKPTRRCMTEQEMLAVGMSKNDKGQWIVQAYTPGTHKKDGDNVEEVAD